MPLQYGFLFSLALNFIGLLIAAAWFDGIYMASYGWALLAAFILTLLQLVVRPVLFMLTLPLTIISFGLFLLLINGLMFWWAGSLLDGYQVHGFGGAVGGALVVSGLGFLAGVLGFSKKGAGNGRQQNSARVHIFTFQGGRPPGGNGQGHNASRQDNSTGRPPNIGAGRPDNDKNVVDLEVDESGEWKIKD